VKVSYTHLPSTSIFNNCWQTEAYGRVFRGGVPPGFINLLFFLRRLEKMDIFNGVPFQAHYRKTPLWTLESGQAVIADWYVEEPQPVAMSVEQSPGDALEPIRDDLIIFVSKWTIIFARVSAAWPLYLAREMTYNILEEAQTKMCRCETNPVAGFVFFAIDKKGGTLHHEPYRRQVMTQDILKWNAGNYAEGEQREAFCSRLYFGDYVPVEQDPTQKVRIIVYRAGAEDGNDDKTAFKEGQQARWPVIIREFNGRQFVQTTDPTLRLPRTVCPMESSLRLSID
jgi:hypothetical protein